MTFKDKLTHRLALVNAAQPYFLPNPDHKATWNDVEE